MTALFHLVTGPIGAGKTTFSNALAERANAPVFSIDEWMTTLFSDDMPTPLDLPWMLQRVQRCHKQISATAIAAGYRGVDVVLDLGFTSKAHRKAFAARARSAGHEVKLHWLDVPIDVRWKRVEERNVLKGPSYALASPPKCLPSWKAATSRQMMKKCRRSMASG